MSERITVALRMRPLNSREIECDPIPAWIVNKNSNTLHLAEYTSKNFVFDKVFDGDSTTSQVYDEVAKNIIGSAIKGKNGTVFAYGQTSTGKTHTMRGHHEHHGLIPLAMKDLFTKIESDKSREFLLRVSYLEIYNESIIDLLSSKVNDLKLFQANNGEVIIEGVTKAVVVNIREVMKQFDKGESFRHFAETEMNKESSRSHTIFQLYMESREKYKSDSPVRYSTINLVDLAGSERVLNTKSREGSHINKSLLTLQRVIHVLSDNTNPLHIPYRDSKLTRILEPALGGNSRTAIIVTITPSLDFIEETKSSIQFALRARNVTNNVEVNQKSIDDSEKISHLKRKIYFLEEKLHKNSTSKQDLRAERNKDIKEELDFVKRKLEHSKRSEEAWKERFRKLSGKNAQGVHSKVNLKKRKTLAQNDSNNFKEEHRKQINKKEFHEINESVIDHLSAPLLDAMRVFYQTSKQKQLDKETLSSFLLNHLKQNAKENLIISKNRKDKISLPHFSNPSFESLKLKFAKCRDELEKSKEEIKSSENKRKKLEKKLSELEELKETQRDIEVRFKNEEKKRVLLLDEIEKIKNEYEQEKVLQNEVKSRSEFLEKTVLDKEKQIEKLTSLNKKFKEKNTILLEENSSVNFKTKSLISEKKELENKKIENQKEIQFLKKNSEELRQQASESFKILKIQLEESHKEIKFLKDKKYGEEKMTDKELISKKLKLQLLENKENGSQKEISDLKQKLKETEIKTEMNVNSIKTDAQQKILERETKIALLNEDFTNLKHKFFNVSQNEEIQGKKIIAIQSEFETLKHSHTAALKKIQKLEKEKLKGEGNLKRKNQTAESDIIKKEARMDSVLKEKEGFLAENAKLKQRMRAMALEIEEKNVAAERERRNAEELEKSVGVLKERVLRIDTQRELDAAAEKEVRAEYKTGCSGECLRKRKEDMELYLSKEKDLFEKYNKKILALSKNKDEKYSKFYEKACKKTLDLDLRLKRVCEQNSKILETHSKKSSKLERMKKRYEQMRRQILSVFEPRFGFPDRNFAGENRRINELCDELDDKLKSKIPLAFFSNGKEECGKKLKNSVLCVQSLDFELGKENLEKKEKILMAFASIYTALIGTTKLFETHFVLVTSKLAKYVKRCEELEKKLCDYSID